MAGDGWNMDETRTLISKCLEPSQHLEQVRLGFTETLSESEM